MKKLIDVLYETECDKEVIIKISTNQDFKLTSLSAIHLLYVLSNSVLECSVKNIETKGNVKTILLY